MHWKPLAVRTATLGTLWWVLSGAPADSWYVGGPAIVGALLAAQRLQPAGAASIRAAALLPYVWFFVVASLRGGLQVALRAIRPDPDLRPAMLDVTLQLPGQAERLFLASSISMLPGTVATELDGDLLRLHLLDGRLAAIGDVRSAEQHVARLFGLEPA